MIHQPFNVLSLAMALVLTSSLAARADSPAPAATPSQATLLDTLKSNASLEQKVIACRQLAWIGNRDAVPVLAGLLSDEKLSHMARYALEQIPDPSVEEALRAAALKVKGKLLAGVLSSLGARRDAKSIEMISQRIKDPDADVAKAAAFALGKIGTPTAAEKIEQALATAPEPIKPALCDAALRCADKLLAEKHRDEAVALFERIAFDAPIQFRVAAVRGAILNGPHAEKLLAELLESNDRAMFNLALQLAHQFPSPEATTTYVSHIGKLTGGKQALVIQALGQRGDKAALPAIRAEATQTDPAVRIAVIRALAQLEDAQSLPAILDATVSPEKDVSDAAIIAVVKMPLSDVDAALSSMVESPGIRKRMVAIDCLGRRRTASATQALLKIASGENSETRQAAIKALAQVASEADLPQAIAVLKKAASPTESVAAENVVIAICISAGDKEACAEKVVAAMTAATPEQKLPLLHVLTAIGGPKGLQAVREAIHSAPNDVRQAAVVALCAWPDQAAAPDLMALARDASQSSNKIRALRGYLRLALDVDLSPERRLEMATSATPLIERDEERRLLLRVLSRAQSPKALPAIEAFLDVPAVKTDAATAAVAVAGKLAQSPDAQSSAAAIAAAMERVKQSGVNAELQKKAADIHDRVRPLLPKPKN